MVVLWQGCWVIGILGWLFVCSLFDLTRSLRSLFQPIATRHVISNTPLILSIQKYRNRMLDALFSGLSCVVSVPFYTAFLPLLFWSGHSKLARQMTFLMALCDYLGNSIKDLISSPRPISPPVRRHTPTPDEQDNALEYGLPSSHTLNTLCLAGYISSFYTSFYSVHFPILPKPPSHFSYLLHYVVSPTHPPDSGIELAGFVVVFLFVGLVAFGRIYLGMHSFIDVISGLAFGVVILSFWILVCEFVDNFVVFGDNVIWFTSALSVLLLFAYPTPEIPTPSFEYHTAFNGVAFGIVTGVHQTYHQFHHENVARVFTSELTFPSFVCRMIVGIPTILFVKFCSKAISKWAFPVVSHALGIPIRSTCCIPTLVFDKGEKTSEQEVSYVQKIFLFLHVGSLDVDTGIRFIQYAGLAWSVVDLVPSMFAQLGL